MDNKQKRICPKCNRPGSRQDGACQYCGIRLISQCPECQAPIRVAFAGFCYRCGVQFSKTVVNRNNLIFEVECLQTGGAVGVDTRDGVLLTKGASK